MIMTPSLSAPVTPPSTAMLLAQMHQKKANDMTKKREELVNSMMAENASSFNLKRPAPLGQPRKPKAAKKLSFDLEKETVQQLKDLEALDQQSLLDKNVEFYQTTQCYCGDDAKVCESKAGLFFYCCPNSRFNNTTKEFESDCDFFLMRDQLINKACKCGHQLREFETKDKKSIVQMCIYKNAPTVWKKVHNYNCNMIDKRPKE